MPDITEKDLQLFDLEAEVERLVFITNAMMHDLQELILLCPPVVQQHFATKRVLYRGMIITCTDGTYYLNGTALSLSIIEEAIRRAGEGPEVEALLQQLYALSPIKKA